MKKENLTTYTNVKNWLNLPHRFETEITQFTGVLFSVVIGNGKDVDPKKRPIGDEIMIFSNTVNCGEIICMCKSAGIDIEHYLEDGEGCYEFNGNHNDVKGLLNDYPDKLISEIEGLWGFEVVEE